MKTPKKTDSNFLLLFLLRKIARRTAVVLAIEILVYFIILQFPNLSSTTVIFCGTLSCILCFVPFYYAIGHFKKFILVLSCISIINIAPIWFLYLEILLPGYDAYIYIEPIHKLEALLWSSLFVFFMNLFYLLMWEMITKYSINFFSFLDRILIGPKVLTYVTIISFLLPLIFYYFYYGSTKTLWIALTAGRSGGGGGIVVRESLGGLSAITQPIAWLWQLTPLFGTIAYISSRNQKPFLARLSLMLGILVIFSFFLGGSRGTLIMVAAPTLFYFLYYNWNKGIRFWVISIVGILMLIGIMELQVKFRGNLLDVLSDIERTKKFYGMTALTNFDPTKTHRDNNTYLFCLMLKNYPNKLDFEGFNEFLAILVNPIPRYFWPNKPILMGAKDISEMPKYILTGPLEMGTTSLTFSVVGEAYQADGIIGILVYAFVYAILLLFFDGIIYYCQLTKPIPIGILGMAFFVLFWGFRAFFALITSLYPIILLLLILRFFAKR